jgi:hypothetical protein
MQIMNFESVETSGDYIHAFINVYMENFLFREVYTKYNMTTGTSRSYVVINGCISSKLNLTNSECDQINNYIMSELLQTA